MGHYRFIRVLALALAMVSGLLVHSARAQNEKLSPHITFAQGQQWSFESVVKQSNTMQMISQGQTIPQGDQGMQIYRGGNMEVMAVKDGLPTKLRISFGPKCGNVSEQNGQEGNQAFALAGKTVVVSKDDLGIMTVDGAEINQETTSELQEMITPDHSLFPKAPVGVGEEWDGDTTAMTKQFGLTPADSIAVKCKFVKVGMVDNHKTADVSVNANITKSQDGVTIKISMSGVAQVDLQTSNTLKADINGTMDTSGQTQGAQGQVVGVVGKGKMEIHQVQKLLSGGAPGPVPVEVHVTPGPNPLGNNVEKSAFAGTFQGNPLSCELSEGEGAGQLKGTLTLGSQRFPATAKEDSGKVSGSFTAGGNSFAFTATLQGDKMMLSSGGKDYTLTRVAINPLGGGTEPPNPLAH